MNGSECAAELLKSFPETKIIVLTMHQERSIIEYLISLGVKGYLLKSAAKEDLAESIRQVNGNKEYYSASITKILLDPKSKQFVNQSNSNLPPLSDREIEIIKLLTEGMTNQQIGEKLYISHKTVDTHRSNIMKKLDVHNVAGVIRFAFQKGLAK